MNVLKNFKPVKAFVFDVDGVLTDGTVLLFDDGQMARRMNIKDGYALQLAIKKGYFVLILSGGSSDAVVLRLQKLGISDIFMKVVDKKTLLTGFANENDLGWEQILYMGDDIPDLAAMEMCGLPCCPADAIPEIKTIAKYISPANGGNGCVRDVIEKVLKLHENWTADESVASR